MMMRINKSWNESIRVCFREDDNAVFQLTWTTWNQLGCEGLYKSVVAGDCDSGVMGERADRWLGVVAWGERRGVRRERSGKWKERRKRNTLNEQKKKKGKKWEMKIWGKIFAGRKKKSRGESLSYRVFYFFFIFFIRLYN